MTKNLIPKRVFASYSHAVIIDKKDEIWRCGTIKRSGNNNAEYDHVSGIKEKVKLVACGKFNIFVVTENNSIYR